MSAQNNFLTKSCKMAEEAGVYTLLINDLEGFNKLGLE